MSHAQISLHEHKYQYSMLFIFFSNNTQNSTPAIHKFGYTEPHKHSELGPESQFSFQPNTAEKSVTNGCNFSHKQSAIWSQNSPKLDYIHGHLMLSFIRQILFEILVCHIIPGHVSDLFPQMQIEHAILLLCMTRIK